MKEHWMQWAKYWLDIKVAQLNYYFIEYYVIFVSQSTSDTNYSISAKVINKG